MILFIYFFSILFTLAFFFLDLRLIASLTSVNDFLQEYESNVTRLSYDAILADWIYTTNITLHNDKASIEANMYLDNYKSEAYEKSKQFNSEVKSRNLEYSFDIKRQLSMIGEASLEEGEMKRLNSVQGHIAGIYGSGTVCMYLEDGEECMKLQPGLTNIMATSRNYTRLVEAWQKWRDQVGKKIRPRLSELIELKNKRAELNGYKDYGEQMRARYETNGFEMRMQQLNDQLSPLYKLVHAYVRKKLRDVYSEEVIPRGGLIPACVLGDMWGRFWKEIFEIVVPYPDVHSIDPTKTMKDKNITVRQMYEMANEFYTSMGLKPLPDEFYEKSMLVRPNDDRDVVCHGTAWDFMNGKDFRIRMCTEVNFDNFEVIHHELGHIQYFMQYAHLPYVYRQGANDGFHEAVGELMSMPMSTVKHLTKKGLMPPGKKEFSKEYTINFLLRTALKTVVTFPFHYVNDLWRWQAFRGDVPEEKWNSHYWKLKKKYLGVAPPVERTEEHLDIFSIFHVVNDFDMIRYFVRTILQFQFAETLCETSGHVGNPHDCDFSGSKAAGDKLAAMLSLGASRPWPDAMEQLTGTRHLDAESLRNYFAPLEEWLREYLIEHGETPGWE